MYCSIPIDVGILGTKAYSDETNNLAHLVHEFGNVRLPLAGHLQ